MSKKLTFVLAFALVVLPLAANALGLGEIKLNSTLNQTLSADIPVVSAAADEVSSLKVTLASDEQFRQAGIPMSEALSQLQFQVIPGPNGTASVHITSKQPFREPFLDILVDAKWDNGELIREYTVFLNPPNFETATQPSPAPAAASAAPVAAAPMASTAPAATSVVKPAVPAPVPVAVPQTVAPATTVPVISAGTASLGGNYGPIHRGETLSQIAWRLRPQGVTLNQMMIAIYRANPEVFMRNINLMKAGYVLRIPSADDIQAVQIAEANSEVRTQIVEWRNSRGIARTHPASSSPTAEQPSLTLVAPSSAAQTAENQVPGTGKGGSGVSAAAGGASQTQATAAAPAASAAKAPITIANQGLATLQSQASKENQQAAKTKVTPLTPEKPTVTKPLPKRESTKPAPVQPAQSGGLLSSLFNPYIIILIIIVIVLIIIGIIVKKRRNALPPISNKPIRGKLKTPPVETTDWEKEEKAGLQDVTAAPATGARAGAAASAKSGKAGAAAGAAALATTTTLKLDEADPVAESDFHMAYGLYDQAAEVLKKGLAQDPGRRDLKMKLLEVYFTAGDRANFVDTARSLRQEMGATPDKDWEKIAIMGHQVAGDDPLFSGNGAAAGAAGTSVDIPLDSGGTGTAVHTDLDPLAGAFEGVRPVVISETPAAAPADSHVVDFSLPDLEPGPAKAKADAKTATAADTAGAAKKKTGKVGVTTVTADFGTDSQVEFDKALKELSDFVNTNVPPQEEAARSGAAAGTAGLSLAADAEPATTHAGTGSATASGTGVETTGLNEIGTKLDLARAYIDMGDSEGAKNILREVLEEGDTQQKQEAQKLMQQLS